MGHLNYDSNNKFFLISFGKIAELERREEMIRGDLEKTR